MSDLRNLANVLTTAAGLAIELWSSADSQLKAPDRVLPPELEALKARSLQLAAENRGVARAIMEESLSLSIARGVLGLMRARDVGPEQLQSDAEVEAETLENLLAGMSGASVSLAVLVRVAQALDAGVQVVLVPNRGSARTEGDLSTLMREAETLLSAPPTAGAP